jgi:hypothetical protein
MASDDGGNSSCETPVKAAPRRRTRRRRTAQPVPKPPPPAWSVQAQAAYGEQGSPRRAVDMARKWAPEGLSAADQYLRVEHALEARSRGQQLMHGTPSHISDRLEGQGTAMRQVLVARLGATEARSAAAWQQTGDTIIGAPLGLGQRATRGGTFAGSTAGPRSGAPADAHALRVYAAASSTLLLPSVRSLARGTDATHDMVEDCDAAARQLYLSRGPRVARFVPHTPTSTSLTSRRHHAAASSIASPRSVGNLDRLASSPHASTAGTLRHPAVRNLKLSDMLAASNTIPRSARNAHSSSGDSARGQQSLGGGTV